MVVLDAAVRYGIYAKGNSDAVCTVNGQGLATVTPTPVSGQPGDYGGGDAVSFRWVAHFTVPVTGSYVVTCRTGSDSFAVDQVPQVRGLVGTLVYWPPSTIYLLGALPGLWILGRAFAERAGLRRKSGRWSSASPVLEQRRRQT